MTAAPGPLVAIVQPNYLPWRGYFDLINRVDIFVHLDDVQYTKRDWRNRNKVRLTSGGTTWLSVPVIAERDTLIRDARIDGQVDWAGKHLATLEHNYGRAPHFAEYAGPLEQTLRAGHETIADLDIALTEQICRWLGISTTLRRATEFNCGGTKDDRLIALVQEVGGRGYLSGPAARDYIQPGLWEKAEITLDYIRYPDYPPYPQIAAPFEPAVSVIDLLFMTGAEAPTYIWGQVEAGT